MNINEVDLITNVGDLDSILLQFLLEMINCLLLQFRVNSYGKCSAFYRKTACCLIDSSSAWMNTGCLEVQMWHLDDCLSYMDAHDSKLHIIN